MSLDLLHRFDDLFGAGCKADAPTSHGEHLRCSIDGNGQFLQFTVQRSESHKFSIVVDDFGVNLIGNHPDLVLFNYFPDGFKLLTGIDGTGGI